MDIFRRRKKEKKNYENIKTYLLIYDSTSKNC